MTVPRIRSPERDKAFEIYKESGGKIENRRIAEQLGISEKTVGGWKCKDKWEQQLNGVLQTKKRSTPKRGAPKGNQNAKGNKGGNGGPPGNVNAVKHGAYQSLYAAYLPAEERELYEQIPGEADLEEEIRLLRLKMARLLTREHDFFYDGFGNRHNKNISEEDREAGILACAKQLEKLVKTQDQIKRSELDKQEQQVRIAKLQAEVAKITGADTPETADDGFIEALKGMVAEAWAE